MQIASTAFTVADYCAAMKRREIMVNPEYQRSDQVWPPAARSFFIESILLGYPVPKVYLYQKTDIKSRQTIKEIVDGQQRSKTILDFYEDKFSISPKSECTDAAGKTYNELSAELQHSFLDYAISADLFVSASPEEIREVFRRINSYTVPLNPEEQRHAAHQGTFKWFIYKLTKSFDTSLKEIGVFSEKQLVRMGDAKLFSEVTHAFINGIVTTKKKELDGLYEDFDDGFPKEKEIDRRIRRAIDLILGLDEIHNSALMKPHIFYSLLLAASHFLERSEELESIYTFTNKKMKDREAAIVGLTSLAEAIEADTPSKKLRPFVEASSDRTNVESQRKTRLKWLCMALDGALV